MIYIHISPAAYAVIADGVPADRRLASKPSSQGGYWLKLPTPTAVILLGARAKRESLSDTILRVAKLEPSRC
jgi:hypothetical protein